MATHSGILAGKSHGQSSLVGYSPWGHKESDTIERLTHTRERNTLEFNSKNVYWTSTLHPRLHEM